MDVRPSVRYQPSPSLPTSNTVDPYSHWPAASCSRSTLAALRGSPLNRSKVAQHPRRGGRRSITSHPILPPTSFPSRHHVTDASASSSPHSPPPSDRCSGKIPLPPSMRRRQPKTDSALSDVPKGERGRRSGTHALKGPGSSETVSEEAQAAALLLYRHQPSLFFFSRTLSWRWRGGQMIT